MTFVLISCSHVMTMTSLYKHHGYLGEKNQEADSLSRKGDNDDWGMQWWVFKMLDEKWGPHTYDRFASSYNRKCDKFSSKFWCAGCSGVDALSQPWARENNWLVPPPNMITVVVKKSSERAHKQHW